MKRESVMQIPKFDVKPIIVDVYLGKKIERCNILIYAKLLIYTAYRNAHIVMHGFVRTSPIFLNLPIYCSSLHVASLEL